MDWRGTLRELGKDTFNGYSPSEAVRAIIPSSPALPTLRSFAWRETHVFVRWPTFPTLRRRLFGRRSHLASFAYPRAAASTNASAGP
jgi:hypothetical protein